MAENKKQPDRVVRLSVHRNTREQRRLHAVSHDMRRAAAVHTRNKRVKGFVIVSWNADGETVTSWDRGGIPADLFPSYIKMALQREISIGDIRNVTGLPPENPGGDEPA